MKKLLLPTVLSLFVLAGCGQQAERSERAKGVEGAFHRWEGKRNRGGDHSTGSPQACHACQLPGTLCAAKPWACSKLAAMEARYPLSQ